MDLTNNQFNDESMETIFTAMQVNTSIKALIVNNCGIGEEAVKALGSALKDNSSLELVEMRDNRITSDGFLGLVNNLEHNSTLKSVDVKGNSGIDDFAVRKLGFALQEKNEAVIHMDLPEEISPLLRKAVDSLIAINAQSIGSQRKQKLKSSKAIRNMLKVRKAGEDELDSTLKSKHQSKETTEGEAAVGSDAQTEKTAADSEGADTAGTGKTDGKDKPKKKRNKDSKKG